ncbi:hypothetical protein PISL3812_09040 [Talaromyces islandicus]|uniref:Rhodopsin domain-containing protein n=1 Tax=Talaromyces islandicus TaxID=28573 RepID=A0A0U1MAN6_TALIS|nr:hypothetical protein PISL3812_09040 [Talaromyces islandicus]
MSTPSPAEIAYMEAHPHDSKVANLVACGAVTLGIAYIAVILRIVARTKTAFRMGADDYLIILALPIFTVFFAFLCLTCHYGMGKHIIYVTSTKGLIVSMTVVEVLYNVNIMWIKASILVLYVRIFPVRKFQMWTWVMMGVNVAYNITFLICSIAQCLPIESRWDTSIPSVCLDYYAVVVASGVVNIVTDVIILAMPIPLIHQLHIPGRKKHMLSAVFATGAVACFISIARCIEASALGSADSTWDQVSALYVTSLEISVGIVSACVPTYRPLISKVSEKIMRTNAGTIRPTDHYQLSATGKNAGNRYFANGWSKTEGSIQSNLPDDSSAKGITISRDYHVIAE